MSTLGSGSLSPFSYQTLSLPSFPITSSVSFSCQQHTESLLAPLSAVLCVHVQRFQFLMPVELYLLHLSFPFRPIPIFLPCSSYPAARFLVSQSYYNSNAPFTLQLQYPATAFPFQLTIHSSQTHDFFLTGTDISFPSHNL